MHVSRQHCEGLQVLSIQFIALIPIHFFPKAECVISLKEKEATE